MIVDRYYVRLI